MAVIVVPIRGARESIRVEATNDTVRLLRRGVWEQHRSREEAWRLAEAIERVATTTE